MAKMVGIREAKARFSHYIDLAREGEDIVVTHRGRAVVRLVAADALASTQTVEELFDELARAGVVERGKGRLPKLRKPAKPKRRLSLTKLVHEQRR
jgi:prevent-host-death family protein